MLISAVSWPHGWRLCSRLAAVPVQTSPSAFSIHMIWLTLIASSITFTTEDSHSVKRRGRNRLRLPDWGCNLDASDTQNISGHFSKTVSFVQKGCRCLEICCGHEQEGFFVCVNWGCFDWILLAILLSLKEQIAVCKPEAILFSQASARALLGVDYAVARG